MHSPFVVIFIVVVVVDVDVIVINVFIVVIIVVVIVIVVVVSVVVDNFAVLAMRVVGDDGGRHAICATSTLITAADRR